MKEKVISVTSLSKWFGSFQAVKEISFDVYRGEVFGFLGANGAGKTTAMRMLCGLLQPSTGIATVAGYDVDHQRELVKQHIGYMSQHFSLYEELTVNENIRLFGGIYQMNMHEIKEKRQQLLLELGLESEKDTLVNQLPLGWKQKLAFSVAIFHQPAVVFLDEPTAGVDPFARRRFWRMIYDAAAKGITIFVTTHYLDEAAFCDRVSIMVDGKIAALDTPKNLLREYQSADMQEVFFKVASAMK